MWPKFLDLSSDECRGMLRRLGLLNNASCHPYIYRQLFHHVHPPELESYSNIVGAFRAQGTLNAAKLKILKDLRGALHISETRHKAEVRRVVNDESLSTIAKTVSGPNSEIEWNREGSRGHTILQRNMSYTALSVAANDGSAFGARLNETLKEPADTVRETVLSAQDASSNDISVKPLVTDDPQKILRKLDSAATAHTNHSDNRKREASKSNASSNSTTLTNNIKKAVPANRLESPTNADDKCSARGQISTLGRKRAAVLLEIPAKSMLPASSKVARFDPTAVEAESEQVCYDNIESAATEPTNNDSRDQHKISLTECKEAAADKVATPKPVQHHTPSTQPDGKVSRSNGISNIGSPGTAQILKLIDGNAIIMRPTTSAHVVGAKPLLAAAKSPANLFVSKVASSPQSYVTLKASSLEYVSLPKGVRAAAKPQIIQTIVPENSASAQLLSTATNHIISIPASTTVSTTAVLRGSNYLKSGDKQRIVHTVSPSFIDTRTVHDKYPPQYVSKAGTAIHLKPKTVTIHPGTTFSRAVQQFPAKKVVQPKIVYEPYNDWQDYDPNVVDGQNGYVESDGNGHYYQSSVSGDSYADEEIIQEEYITSDTDLENVIEMDVDSPGYLPDEVIVVDGPR